MKQNLSLAKKHMFKGLHPNTILFQGKNTFLEAKKYENVQIWEVLRDQRVTLNGNQQIIPI